MKRSRVKTPCRWMVPLVLALWANTGVGESALANPRTPSLPVGLLAATGFGATPDDDTDDTKAIQQAMEAARDRGMATYLAPGTYRISDTLRCFQRARTNGLRLTGERRKPCVLVGANQGKASRLQLVDNAPGFDNPQNPKPLVWIWAQPPRGPNAGSEDPLHGDQSVSFNQVIKGIELDLRAKGNSGAVGIRHAGSQGSTIESVSIQAQGAFAGLYDTPGQGGGVYDLEVSGGAYGIYAGPASRYPIIVGSRFFSQEKSAIHWTGHVVLVLVGFSIEKTTPGPVIVLQQRGAIYGRGIALVDGTIKAPGPLAIDNDAGRALTLTNVYVKTDQSIVRSATTVPVPRHGTWTHVEEYTYTGNGYVSMIDGAIQREGHETVAASESAPPSGDALIQKHLWDPHFPNFDDPDAVDVRQYGARPDDAMDDTDAIQEALDRHSKVLLPKGVFLLSRPLQLGPSNHLFGVGKTFSVLREHGDWKAHATAPLVTTVAAADAQTSLSFLFIETLTPGRIALQWRAGSASVVRDIMAGPVSAYYGKQTGRPGHLYGISETGGGRWYGTAAEWGDLHGSTFDPAYAHLRVAGTSQPLAFYGLNIERDAIWPQAVISDSSHVDFFYFKTEADEWPKGTTPPGVMLVERCEDIRVFGTTGNAHPPGSALITLDNSANVLLTHVAGFEPSLTFSNVTEARAGNSISTSGATPLALFKRQAETTDQFQ